MSNNISPHMPAKCNAMCVRKFSILFVSNCDNLNFKCSTPNANMFFCFILFFIEFPMKFYNFFYIRFSKIMFLAYNPNVSYVRYKHVCNKLQQQKQGQLLCTTLVLDGRQCWPKKKKNKKEKQPKKYKTTSIKMYMF